MITTKRIHQLPVHLANQIAAGEVIERPASVLKELLENSLDANSTQIEINIERGGIGLIRVQDNGAGICKDDLKLAVSPHATSKIETSADLEGIVSYGFRGEALASISAVSRLYLSSAIAEEDIGWSIKVEGRDTTPALMPVPKCCGTLVEIKDLFYNTPARRKFLRAEKTEMNYIEEVFKRIALSQPQVAFKFAREGRLQKRLPICRNLEAHARRIAMVCGQSFIQDAYYIEAETNGLRLTGWLGSPKAMRSQADLQYFYVNGRIIRDKVVMHAVRQAYQEMNIEGRYPAYILYFELDPAAVDVNVHPTKHEVRFREARTVHAFLSYAIQEGLIKGKEALSNFSKAPQNLQKKFEFKDPKQAFSFLYQSEEPNAQSNKLFSAEIVEKKASEKFLSILGGNFLFVENEEGMTVIDVPMARQVLISQSLVYSYEKEGIKKRVLIMPKMIMIPKDHMQKLFDLNWERLGFEITEAGENAVLVRSVPEVISGKIEDINALLSKLLVLDNPHNIFQLIVDSITANQSLDESQQRQLLKDVFEFKKINGNNESSKFCKQFTAQRLRTLLF